MFVCHWGNTDHADNKQFQVLLVCPCCKTERVHLTFTFCRLPQSTFLEIVTIFKTIARMSQTLEWRMSQFVETNEALYIKRSSVCPYLDFFLLQFCRSLQAANSRPTSKAIWWKESAEGRHSHLHFPNVSLLTGYSKWDFDTIHAISCELITRHNPVSTHYWMSEYCLTEPHRCFLLHLSV